MTIPKGDTMLSTANDLDACVRTYLDLVERIEALTAERDSAKAALRELEIGAHPTSFGVTVHVAANRRLDADAAYDALTAEQQALCQSPDAKKIREQLPPAAAEAFMREVGLPRVTVK